MLTEDQRWLLRTVGFSLSRALLSDEGLKRLMSSASGYYGTPRDGAPEWMDSYEVHGGRIVSPVHGRDVRVTVTMQQLRAFGRSIPADLFDELAAIDKAETDERQRTELWCRCHFSKGREPEPHQDFLRRDHYHPTDAEDAAHISVVRDLRERERDCLDAILGVSDQEPVGQLELFGVGA
ncbi:hypothetical protein [Mycobacteroides chelonae]|uniref:hypothetical protein n=1 Tax=Mycobacteroides chelonae TaxID=1774 RepID=UPI001F1C4439|nr:hypothetical protein [Mycobacteroides chelonae]